VYYVSGGGDCGIGRWLIAAFAAAALIVVASATSQVVVGRTAFRAVKVSAGATKTVSVSCPAGYFAVSAGAAKSGEGIKELQAKPLSLRTFAFRLANRGGLDQRVTVAAACRRVRAARGKVPYLKLVSRRRVTVRVAPAAERQARFTCPSDTVPAAAGFDLGRGNLSVRQQTQDLHRLTFTVSNNGTTAKTVSLYAGCLTVVRPAGARATQLQVSLATDTVPLPNGSQVVTRLCPRGWLSLAAGYSLPAGVELNGAVAVARTGRWSFTNSAQKPVLAQLQLACLRLS
jgi:hypothetical protein